MAALWPAARRGVEGRKGKGREGDGGEADGTEGRGHRDAAARDVRKRVIHPSERVRGARQRCQSATAANYSVNYTDYTCRNGLVHVSKLGTRLPLL